MQINNTIKIQKGSKNNPDFLKRGKRKNGTQRKVIVNGNKNDKSY